MLFCSVFHFLGQSMNEYVIIHFCRIVDESTKEAAAVDPVEPEKVLEASISLGLTIKFVLTTHHHWFVTFSSFVITKSFIKHTPVSDICQKKVKQS